MNLEIIIINMPREEINDNMGDFNRELESIKKVNKWNI